MDYTQSITMEPGKRSGKPCIRGLRITVGDVLEYLAAGMSHAEILHDFLPAAHRFGIEVLTPGRILNERLLR